MAAKKEEKNGSDGQLGGRWVAHAAQHRQARRPDAAVPVTLAHGLLRHLRGAELRLSHPPEHPARAQDCSIFSDVHSYFKCFQ